MPEAPRSPHAGRGGINAAVLAELVERGLTIREIAAELDRSYTTIRYWLARYELRTTAEARQRRRSPPLSLRFRNHRLRAEVRG